MPAIELIAGTKTLDGTTGETTSYLTRLSKYDSQVIGYSHSTKRAKNARQVAGYVRAPAWLAPTNIPRKR
jgi:hypothetical protein